jgi:23S rRNA (adenine2503-C2)-methyltransferase
LISGKNDTPEQAERLAHLLNSRLRGKEKAQSLPIHVNLIPVNQVDETEFVRSAEAAIRAFAKVLENRGIRATVRRKLGPDINASCGQLRRSEMKNASL